MTLMYKVVLIAKRNRRKQVTVAGEGVPTPPVI